MIVLDAYALISMLAGGAAEQRTRAILDGGDACVSTVNLAEIYDVLERVRRVPREEVDRVVQPLLGATIVPVPCDVATALRAAEIRVAHYHRRRRSLSLADCVALATGAPGDAIATADPQMLAVAPLLGLDPIELPAEG